jgi:hypothetical protein
MENTTDLNIPRDLTPEELEDLKRDTIEAAAYFKKAFADVKPLV